MRFLPLLALAACHASIAPVTPAPSPSLVVYGGRDGRDATLVDLAVAPDGRIAALACVNRSLVALRWERTGRLAVEKPIGPTCTGRLVRTHDDDLVIADSVCVGSPADEENGCIRVRRFDPSVTAARWTYWPKLSVVNAFAIGSADQIAIGGWRAASYAQDPTKTDIHVVDAKSAMIRTHEMLALRTDLADVAFLGEDLVVAGSVDPDNAKGTFTIDGTVHAFTAYDTTFVVRLGPAGWFTRFDEMKLESYDPPRLVVLDPKQAVVVAMARPRRGVIRAVGYTGAETVEVVVRLDLATGAIGAGTHRKAGEFNERIAAAIPTRDGIAISKPVVRDANGGTSACHDGEKCKHYNGPQAFGDTTVPQVHRIDPKAPAFGPELTSYSGYGITNDMHLAYAADARALYLGGSLTGTLRIDGRTITTEQTRFEPCNEGKPHRRGRHISAGGAPFLFGLEPLEDPCTVGVTYTSAVFVARVN